MFNEEYKEQIFFEDYKKNILSTNSQTESKITKINYKSFQDKNFKQSEIQLFFISIILNFFYLLHQILLFRKPETASELYVTIIIISLQLILQATFFFLKFINRGKFEKCLQKLNSDIMTSFSYFSIYIHILSISIISFFSTRNKDKDPTILPNYFSYECLLILSSCLIFRTNAYKFLTNKIFRILYIIFTLSLILFISFIKKKFLILIDSLTFCILLFLICFIYQKREIFLMNQFKEINSDTQKIFNHFHSTTKALNVAIFLFKNEELTFSNEIGNNILETFSLMPLKKMSQESLNLNDNQTEIKQNTEYADFKVNITDSKMNLNNFNINRDYSYKSNKSVREKNEVRLIFKNIFMYEDTLNICDIIKKCKTNKVNRKDFKDGFEKIQDENKNPCLNDLNVSNLNFNSKKKRNLHSIFRFLIRSSSHSDPEIMSNCNCLSHLKGFVNLGIFEFQPRDKKIFYEIIMKLDHENNPTENTFIEFIFKDVTSNFDLFKQVEENEIKFKKNAHELKTPILSMLGCGEDLKSQFKMMENLLPDNEKNKIKNSLEHMTNLSSFIGYLIKGLTNKDSNSVNRNKFKKIQLNSLLKFCFDILQTLLSCDEQKSKNVKTELKNLVSQDDVYFKSDEIHVKQILLNFISNSVKFTNYGKITMSAKIKKKLGKDILKVKIKDTGCGVKKEDSSKLFFQYSKLNKSSSNEFGSGLGLNISKTIAESLNMRIKFKSEENKGTKVSLYIFNPKLSQSQINFKSNKTTGSNLEPNNMIQFGKGVHQRCTSDQNLRFAKNKLIINEEENESKLDQANKSITRFEDFVNSQIEKKKTKSLKLNRTGSFRMDESSPNIFGGVDEEEGENYSKILEEDFYKKDTLVNPIMTEFNYSQLSFSSSQSSDTFEMDSNKKIVDLPTRRENKNYTFGLSKNQVNSKNFKTPRIIKNCHNDIEPINSESEKNSILTFNYISKLSNKQCSLLNNRNVPKNLIINSNIITNNSNRTIKEISANKSEIRKSLFEEKVIVVDDQAPSRRALVNLIKNYCTEKDIVFEIVECCDGIDCLNTVIKYPSRVRYIFIDENMSFMNGTEAAEIIRKYCETGKIAKMNLILTSAEDNIKRRKDLFDFCMTKPLTRENIKEIFEQT